MVGTTDIGVLNPYIEASAIGDESETSPCRVKYPLGPILATCCESSTLGVTARCATLHTDVDL